MERREMMVMTLFSIAGLAIILWQHTHHTGQIVSALGFAPGATGDVTTLRPLSLAGTPAKAQANLEPEAIPAVPIVAGAGWTVH